MPPGAAVRAAAEASHWSADASAPLRSQSAAVAAADAAAGGTLALSPAEMLTGVNVGRSTMAGKVVSNLHTLVGSGGGGEGANEDAGECGGSVWDSGVKAKVALDEGESFEVTCVEETPGRGDTVADCSPVVYPPQFAAPGVGAQAQAHAAAMGEMMAHAVPTRAPGEGRPTAVAGTAATAEAAAAASHWAAEAAAAARWPAAASSAPYSQSEAVGAGAGAEAGAPAAAPTAAERGAYTATGKASTRNSGPGVSHRGGPGGGGSGSDPESISGGSDGYRRPKVRTQNSKIRTIDSKTYTLQL